MNEPEIARGLVGALGLLDLVILGAAVAALFVIAYLTGRRQESTGDFFLGARRIPAVVACLSFVATEVSAVTIVGVPAAAYSENWQYLQFFIGSAAARLFIAFLFIPVFYHYSCTTIYEFLRHRFGAETQVAGSVFFFITRLLASGVRLYAASLGVSLILGWSVGASVLVFSLVGIAFIGFGGIKAVVWTGAFETLVFYAAGGAVAVYLLMHIDGGLGTVWRTAGEAGRLSLINPTLNFSDPKTLWAATFNAFFVGLSVFGTDQELMQRLLTVKTRRASQKALIGTILAGLPIVCLYLAVGTLIFVFLRQNPDVPPPAKADQVLSHFVVHAMPMGFRGLVLAAVILASIDSPLSSLASSFVTDIYRPLIRKGATERHYLWVSRLSVGAFGIVLALVALTCQTFEGVLWFAFKVISVTGGSTLGVFLLGVLTRRRTNRGNVIGMILGALVAAALLILSERKTIALGWTWLIVIGSVVTFCVGWALGRRADATEMP